MSTAGRDRGNRYAVIGLESPKYVLLADGVVRTWGRPKRKNIRHLVKAGPVEPDIAGRAKSGRGVSNGLIRTIIAKYGADVVQDEASAEGG